MVAWPLGRLPAVDAQARPGRLLLQLLLPAGAIFRPQRLVSRTRNGDLTDNFKPRGNCLGLQREVLPSGFLQGSLVPKDDPCLRVFTSHSCPQLHQFWGEGEGAWERVVKDRQKNGKMPAEPGLRNLQAQETGLLAPG